MEDPEDGSSATSYGLTFEEYGYEYLSTFQNMGSGIFWIALSLFIQLCLALVWLSLRIFNM
jgi:hypothetical protein